MQARGYVLVWILLTQVQKIDSTASCQVPSVPREKPTNITCHFTEDLVQTEKAFAIHKYDTKEQFEELLNCPWIEYRHVCDILPGYEFDRRITNKVTLKIPSATEENVGKYVCQVIPSDTDVLAPCTFTITKNMYHTVTEKTTAALKHQEDKTNENLLLGILLSVFLVVIPVVILVIVLILCRHRLFKWIQVRRTKSDEQSVQMDDMDTKDATPQTDVQQRRPLIETKCADTDLEKYNQDRNENTSDEITRKQMMEEQTALLESSTDAHATQEHNGQKHKAESVFESEEMRTKNLAIKEEKGTDHTADNEDGTPSTEPENNTEQPTQEVRLDSTKMRSDHLTITEQEHVSMEQSVGSPARTSDQTSAESLAEPERNSVESKQEFSLENTEVPAMNVKAPDDIVRKQLTPLVSEKGDKAVGSDDEMNEHLLSEDASVKRPDRKKSTSKEPILEDQEQKHIGGGVKTWNQPAEERNAGKEKPTLPEEPLSMKPPRPPPPKYEPDRRKQENQRERSKQSAVKPQQSSFKPLEKHEKGLPSKTSLPRTKVKTEHEVEQRYSSRLSVEPLIVAPPQSSFGQEPELQEILQDPVPKQNTHMSHVPATPVVRLQHTQKEHTPKDPTLQQHSRPNNIPPQLPARHRNSVQEDVTIYEQGLSTPASAAQGKTGEHDQDDVTRKALEKPKQKRRAPRPTSVEFSLDAGQPTGKDTSPAQQTPREIPTPEQSGGLENKSTHAIQKETLLTETEESKAEGHIPDKTKMCTNNNKTEKREEHKTQGSTQPKQKRRAPRPPSFGSQQNLSDTTHESTVEN